MAELVRSLLDGARLVCPRCRDGRIYASFFTMRTHCPTCGIDFDPGRGQFTGPLMFAWGIVGMAALMGFFILHLLDAPLWAQYGWPLVAATAGPLLLYRHLKGAWVGLLWATDELRPPPASP